MVVVIGDKIVTVGDSARHVNIYSKKLKLMKSFKLREEKEKKKKKACPRGISTDIPFKVKQSWSVASLCQTAIRPQFPPYHSQRALKN